MKNVELNNEVIGDAKRIINQLNKNKFSINKWVLIIATILLFIPSIHVTVSISILLYVALYMWSIDGLDEERTETVEKLLNGYTDTYFAHRDLSEYIEGNALEIWYLYKTGYRTLNVRTGSIDDEEASYSRIYNSGFKEGEEVPHQEAIEAMRANYSLSESIVFVDGETNKVIAFRKEKQIG